jgi:hypothetical protein
MLNHFRTTPFLTTSRMKIRSSRATLAKVHSYLVVSMLLAFFVVWGLEVIVRGHPPMEECATVADGNERLACYDKFSGRTVTQPAKGAIAPLAQ